MTLFSAGSSTWSGIRQMRTFSTNLPMHKYTCPDDYLSGQTGTAERSASVLITAYSAAQLLAGVAAWPGCKSRALALRGPGVQALDYRLPASLPGLAFERRASVPGPRPPAPSVQASACAQTRTICVQSRCAAGAMCGSVQAPAAARPRLGNGPGMSRARRVRPVCNHEAVPTPLARGWVVGLERQAGADWSGRPSSSTNPARETHVQRN